MKLLAALTSALALLTVNADLSTPREACLTQHDAGTRAFVKCVKEKARQAFDAKRDGERAAFDAEKKRQRNAFEAQKKLEQAAFDAKRASEQAAFNAEKKRQRDAFEAQKKLEQEAFDAKRATEIEAWNTQKALERDTFLTNHEEDLAAFKERKAEAFAIVAARKKQAWVDRKALAAVEKTANRQKKREEVAIRAATKADAVFRWAMTKYRIADHHQCTQASEDDADFYAGLIAVVNNNHKYMINFVYQDRFSVVAYDHGLTVKTLSIVGSHGTDIAVRGHPRGVWKIEVNEFFDGPEAYNYLLDMLSDASSISPKFYICPYTEKFEGDDGMEFYKS